MSSSLHPAARSLARFGFTAKPASAPIMDSATGSNAIMDSTSFEVASIRLEAVAQAQQWALTVSSDLEDGETLADRFQAHMVGVADLNKDGELTPDEEIVITAAMESAGQYLIEKGAAPEDVDALINDVDPAAAERIRDLVAAAIPADEEEASAEADGFTFDAEAQADIFDSVESIMDAVYRKRVVVRGGKKAIVRKRVSGTVRLSTAQKAAIRKAVMKSHSAAARISRMKSNRVRAKLGLK
jgi:hypothetical protein